MIKELRAEDMGKAIKGNEVLSHINLTFSSGRVYGIQGRNGSGKTMLFRGLSGLMKLSCGAVFYDDVKLGTKSSVLPNLGITIENTRLYAEFTGYKNLELLAKINHKIGRKEIIEAICRVGLNPKDKRGYYKYSMGMKQRIAIAQAIMEKPDIIMLDEPTNGLDEDGVKLIRTIINEEKQRGAIVLLASHNKEDMDLLADELIHIQAGKIVKEG